jgi:hypothetical protein
MPRISPLPAEERDAATQEALDRHVNDHHARITNMKATMAYSLVTFESYMSWYPLYDEVKRITGPRLAYLYAYSISLASECPLCTTFFRKIIIDAGEKPEDFEVNEEEQQLLDFGSAIATNKGQVDDKTYQPIRERYSVKDLVVLIGFAGQMIATNIFNNVIDTDIDDYLSDYLPLTK